MKRYPMEIRQAVIRRIKGGESQESLSREYGISRWAIQCWLKERHLVGKLFCKLKNNRRFATEYEKNRLFSRLFPPGLHSCLVTLIVSKQTLGLLMFLINPLSPLL